MDVAKARISEFLLKYGEKANALLEAIREAYSLNTNKEAGDFSYRQVQEVLERKGYNFDPRNLLRIMERDYGLIETSFRTSNQHWWKVKAPEILSDSDRYTGLEDPRLVAIRIKAASLDLANLRKRLEFMLRKPVLTEADKREFRRFSFNELNDIVSLLEEASQYPEAEDVTSELKAIISLAYEIGKRVSGKGNNTRVRTNEGEEKNSYDNVLRLPDNENHF
jgi:integrase